MQEQPIPTPLPSPSPVQGLAPAAGRAAPTAAEMYQAATLQRRELIRQRSELVGRREDIADQLREPDVAGADRAGLEQQLKALDAQIASLDQEIAAANARVAQAAGVPGAIVEPPRRPDPGPPEEVFVLGGLLITFVFFPLAIAYARRIWKRGAGVAAVPPQLSERLTRIEQAMDAIAVEVERLGESQRFVARVLAPPPAQPIDIPAREAVPEQRR